MAQGVRFGTLCYDTLLDTRADHPVVRADRGKVPTGLVSQAFVPFPEFAPVPIAETSSTPASPIDSGHRRSVDGAPENPFAGQMTDTTTQGLGFSMTV